MDPSKITRNELDVIAAKLNNRPCKMHKIRTQLELFEGPQAKLA